MNVVRCGGDPVVPATAEVVNVILMAAKKERRRVETPASEPERPDGAFDLWLRRGLHQLFDDVASEPVPDELLRLIQDDRNRRQ